MKTAIIQLNSTVNKNKNVEKAVFFIEKAAGKKAKFVLLPEVFSYRGPLKKMSDWTQNSESIPGALIRQLMDLSKKCKIYLLAGSILEKVKGSRKVYNTSVLINDQGKIDAIYRKIHLFDATVNSIKIRESNYLLAGKNLVTAEVLGFKLGLSICYDLRFSQLYHSYLQKGAEILCIPSAFTKKTGEAHWEALLRARAIENLCYVLAPNQIGQDSRGVKSYGNSMIVSPWGEILARGSSNKEEILYAEIEKKTLKEKRALLPAINIK